MGSEKEITPSGEELYQSFLAGDEYAFEELVALYEHELALFLNSFVQDYHEAKHLMIETFAQLAISKGQFAEKSSFKTYLFTIGKNLTFHYLKMRKKEQCLSYNEVLENLIDSGEPPDRFLEREENRQQLLKAMRSLKEEYRVVLQLLYFQDMSYLEAGRVMKKNEKQITNLAYRAKTALKKKLETSGFTYS